MAIATPNAMSDVPVWHPDRVAVVWFKRDLRLHDHAALAAAACEGRVLPLFIQEPDLLHGDEIDAATIEFAVACAAELDRRLRDLGGRLIVRQGEAVEVLDRLFAVRPSRDRSRRTTPCCGRSTKRTPCVRHHRATARSRA